MISTLTSPLTKLSNFRKQKIACLTLFIHSLSHVSLKFPERAIKNLLFVMTETHLGSITKFKNQYICMYVCIYIYIYRYIDI